MNKVAIVVGHDSKEKGAFSPILNKSEFDYHKELVEHLPFDVYYRNTSGGYKTKMEALARQINAKKYDLVVELHFNSSANPQANGSECLYYYASPIGKRYAEVFTDKVVSTYGMKKRGAIPISNSSDRGYWFLKLMNAPALILEPFFGSNIEANKFKDTKQYAKLIFDTFC